MATANKPMVTIKKKDLIDRIADATGQKRVVVKRTVQAFLDLIIEEIAKGNRLEFRDFGVFEVKERAARSAQNPKTLQRVQVPKKRTVKFKVGRIMRDCLDNGPGGSGLARSDGEVLEVQMPNRAAATTRP